MRNPARAERLPAMSDGSPDTRSVPPVDPAGANALPPELTPARQAPDRNLALELVRVTDAAAVVDITAPVLENIRRVAKAKRASVEDVTVCILDRPRHQELIQQVRESGARIKFISDGDVAGAISAARPDTGVDLLMGIGG